MSVAQRRRISTLIMSRFARSVMSRASGGSVALSRLWPGRTDRLIIAPHDLRTADATRAAEIYAGRFSRAPRWMQRLGLEWAWRLAQDPGRLWRRYFTTNGRFLVLLLRSWLKLA